MPDYDKSRDPFYRLLSIIHSCTNKANPTVGLKDLGAIFLEDQRQDLEKMLDTLFNQNCITRDIDRQHYSLTPLGYRVVKNHL